MFRIVSVVTLLLAVSSCAVNRTQSRSYLATRDSLAQTRSVSLSTLRTDRQEETHIYGDTLESSMVIPLDSLLTPIRIESTGLSVAVTGGVSDGRLRLAVSATAKPRTSTKSSISAEIRSGSAVAGDVFRRESEKQSTDFRKSSWTVPWWITASGCILAVFIILNYLIRNDKR